ncbi:MAG: POTRA domain-containing protein, partial [Planctomycetota bacterium]
MRTRLDNRWLRVGLIATALVAVAVSGVQADDGVSSDPSRPLPAGGEAGDSTTDRSVYQPPGEGPWRIASIELDVHDVFDEDEQATILHEAATALHWRTREYVIERELLFAEGEPYDPELAEETERNLRALGYIAQARVRPVFDAEAKTVAVKVFTRDKFSLRVGVGAGFVGGASKAGATLGESNLMGFGVTTTLAYRVSDGDQFIGFSFTDPNVLGTRYRFRTS